MPKLGLIGFPLSHSHSPWLFAEIFDSEGLSDWDYRLFPLENINQLHNLIEQEPELIGLNVTIPHKLNVIPLLNWISDEAQKIGAVNTIRIERGRTISLCGYNTDVFGFESLLMQAIGKKPLPEGVLILGSGGAAKAVQYVLHELNIPYLIVSRNKKDNCIPYPEITKETINKYKFIVNTTPVGMHPEIDKIPLFPLEHIGSEHTLIDLIYNPEETLLMKECKKRGAVTFNGKTMLIQQAEKAWEIFNSHTK